MFNIILALTIYLFASVGGAFLITSMIMDHEQTDSLLIRVMLFHYLFLMINWLGNKLNKMFEVEKK